MAKNWYPVIDYITCTECGTCVDKCSHGVYDKAKAPSPVVVHPENCIDHCHGCGIKCPVGAISYVGDDTGWMPPTGQKQEEESGCCCCSCGTDEEKTSSRTVFVEYLYLDLKTCDRCIGADQVLDDVMLTLAPALQLAGYAPELKKVEISTEELANQYHFLASPTIRVNGKDICESVQENSCGYCGNISGTDTNCRVFEYEGQIYEVPPKAMLAQTILKAVFGTVESTCTYDEYRLPDNLKNFFHGKVAKNTCCCGGDCE